MTIADQITPMVLTYNEEANIARCLDRLTWAQRILIVDSGSTDGTLDIASKYPQVCIEQRPFDDFASQCNFGLSRISTPWVLSLDADYELSPELVEEIRALAPGPHAGYEAAFIYRIYGKPLRGTLYPPRTILYLKDRAAYQNEGHGHRVIVQGSVGRLRGRVYHDDRKPLARWFFSQQKYAQVEAAHLLASPSSRLNRADRIRRMAWPAPILVFFYTLIAKRCILDGWAGWFYVLQRTIAEVMIALELVDKRLQSSRRKPGH